jgi:hypothetical protein
MDFLLFLLVNAALLLRPAEIWSGFEKVPLYQYLIVACLIASIPALLGLMLPRSPLKHPVYILVLGVLVAIGASHVVGTGLDRAAEESFEFIKVVIYFTLLVAVVNTTRRLRVFVTALIVFTVIATSISVLNYYELWEQSPNTLLKTADEIEQHRVTGEELRIRRLQLTGVLQDPNEFCMVLGVMVLLTLYKLGDPAGGIGRMLWLGPLLLFLFAVYLTGSRGGQLALMAGLITLAIYTRGARFAFGLGLACVPLLVFAFAFRATGEVSGTSTSQTRIQSWSDWMMDFRGRPVFGIGPEVISSKERAALVGEGKWLAHNSFIQAFADLGFAGGLCFFGLLFFGLLSLHRYARLRHNILDPELRRLYPYLMGAMMVVAMGLMTLSMCYVVPTYLFLGLPVVYCRLTRTWPELPEFGWSGPGFVKWVGSAVGFLAFVYVFVRTFANFG